MTGAEVLAVVACVAAIVSAYRDGCELIKQIRAKRAERRLTLANKSTENLEASLQLGPLVVQGQYDNDYRRFGEWYAQGDHLAREQLKDIIINLQMALLTNLRVSLSSDVELEVDVLLSSSDNSRVEAVMALCHLYQRLAQAAPLQPALPAAPSSITISALTSSGAQYSPTSQYPPHHGLSHVSTMSSVASSVAPTWSRPLSELENQGLDPSQQFRPHIEDSQRFPTPSLSSMTSQTPRRKGLFNGLRNRGARRHSTPAPMAPVIDSREDLGNRAAERIRNSVPAMAEAPAPLSRSPKQSSLAGYFSPDEINPWRELDAVSEDDDDRLAPVQYPDQANNFDPHGWGSEPRNEQEPSPQTDMRPAALRVRPTSSVLSGHSSHSSTSGGTGIHPSTSVSTMLYLPSEENNFAGFCKGAWKLQIGLKKAFSICMRPAGMYNHLPYWRCSKCWFEGPVQGNEGRASWKFDQRVHIHKPTGIRYRWLFLAKSHIETRRNSSQSDGSGGCFGCIYCCAEQRGQAPVFGTLQVFMEHLQEHRQRPIASGLLDRTRCIVGRVAENAEEFDLNIPG